MESGSSFKPKLWPSSSKFLVTKNSSELTQKKARFWQPFVEPSSGSFKATNLLSFNHCFNTVTCLSKIKLLKIMPKQKVSIKKKKTCLLTNDWNFAHTSIENQSLVNFFVSIFVFLDSLLDLWLCLSVLLPFFLVSPSHHNFFPNHFPLESLSAVSMILLILLFLIPAPLVDLRLGESSYFCHLTDFVFGPIHLPIKLLPEHSDLNSAFSLSLFDSILILFIVFRGIFWIGAARAWVGEVFVIIIETVFLRYIFDADLARRSDFGICAKQLGEQVFLDGERRLQILELKFARSIGGVEGLICEGREVIMRVLLDGKRRLGVGLLGSESASAH